MKQIIDLHMHSNVSDGSDTPEEICRKMREIGIRTFSITDHDAYEGSLAAEQMIGESPDFSGLRFFRGIEFSCIMPAGQCHILGYCFDPEADAFQAVYQEGRRRRALKLEKRLEHLRNDHGIILDDADAQNLKNMTSSGKPHLAKVLIRMGYAKTISEAIDRYISDGEFGRRSENSRVAAEAAIDGILRSGGTAVWAHPLGGENKTHLKPDEFRRRLSVLRGYGIQGLECYYSRYTNEEEAFLVNEAKEAGLVISGGSDYHGVNKNISPGTLCADGTVIPPERLTILGRIGRQHG